MAISIDATVSGIDSNSYVTIAEADHEFDYLHGCEEWLELTEEEKIRLLVTATRVIDGLPVKYVKLVEEQKLKFPVEFEGFDLQVVKDVCFKQAFYIYENQSAINEAQAGMIQGVKFEGVGTLRKIITGFNPMTKYAPGVLPILYPYIDLEFKLGRG